MNKGYWYLGSPYSKHPDGLETAFVDICKVAAQFAVDGIPAYSPIAHTHPIAMIGEVDPHDHSIWLPFDGPLMTAARGLVVVMMPSWQDSFGLQHEIEYFKSVGKPILYMDPDEIDLRPFR